MKTRLIRRPSPVDFGVSSRRQFYIFDLILPIVIVAGLTWFFAAGDRDLEIQRAAFDSESQSWKTGDGTFWKAVYHVGPIPAIIVAIAAVIVFVWGFRNAKLARFRRASAFLFLVIAVAAGIIANLILKEHWGRPRPRDVSEFGGRFAFEPVLTIDPVSTGKSFPCGHATMGFFFVAFYFLLRKAKPSWSIAALIGGLGFGVLLGVARIFQGGHFASDVVWAAAVTFFTAVGFFYLLRLNRGVLDDPVSQSNRKIPGKVKLFGAVAILIGVAAVLVATPYSAKRDFQILSTEAKPDSPLDVKLQIIFGEVEIVPGDEFSIRGEAWGHGVPTSKIADKFVEEMKDDGRLRLRYEQRWSGRLTEVGQRLTVTLPWERLRKLELNFSETEAKIALPKLDANERRLVWAGGEKSKICVSVADGVVLRTDFVPPGSVVGTEKLEIKKDGDYFLSWKSGEDSKLIFD